MAFFEVLSSSKPLDPHAGLAMRHTSTKSLDVESQTLFYSAQLD